MNRYLTMAVMAAMTMGCGVAELRGNGVSRSELRAADGFDAVDVSDGIEAKVKLGERTSIEVQGDENLLAHVETRVEGTALVIETRDHAELAPTQPIRVIITTPRMVAIRATGGARISAQASAAALFSVEASGGSTVDVDGLDSKQVEAAANDGATINLSGHAADVRRTSTVGAHINAEKVLLSMQAN